MGGHRIHDLHPSIAPTGLYWVVPVPDGGLKVSQDGRSATLTLERVAVVDQPNYPNPEPTRPATMSLRMVWTAQPEPLHFKDVTKSFEVQGFRATTQGEFSVEIPSLGFRWKSDPLETSSAAFGLIGTERNGAYFPVAMPLVAGYTLAAATAILGNHGITNLEVVHEGPTGAAIPPKELRVARASLAPGTPVAPGSQVVLYVRRP